METTEAQMAEGEETPKQKFLRVYSKIHTSILSARKGDEPMKEASPLTRKRDVDTSERTATKIRLGINETQYQVWFALRTVPDQGLTDSELRTVCERIFGRRAESTWRKRRVELERMELVYRTIDKRLNPGGSEEAVYRLTERGAE